MQNCISLPTKEVIGYKCLVASKSLTATTVSEVPSYRSRITYNEASPAYTATAVTSTTTAASSIRTPRDNNNNNNLVGSSSSSGRQTVGLPPLPPIAAPNAFNAHNFRIPTWSASNAPAARHYRNVAERRAIDGQLQAAAEVVIGMREPPINQQSGSSEGPILRPLEDPYLVGEQAAAEARQQRIAREVGENMLREEDKQWDWMLAQMKTWEVRDRNWTRFRQEAAQSRRRTLFRRIGSRLL